MPFVREHYFQVILSAAAAAAIAGIGAGSEALALDGPVEWGAPQTAAQDDRDVGDRRRAGATKGRVINVAPSSPAAASAGPSNHDAARRALKTRRASRTPVSKASTRIENGVRVTRGAPAKRLIAASLDRRLSGAASPAPETASAARVEKVVIYRQYVRRRRGVAHGFFSGLRRYNRSFGPFPTDTFGFGGYSRCAPRYC